jgi:single-strand DNA-binding protein
MATQSTARGNILVDPELKLVNVRGEQRQICEFRIMSDFWVENAAGEREQDATRTHPVQVTVWGESLAKQCFEVLRKGMRVEVKGNTHPHIYRFSDAERAGGKNDIYELRMAAEDVTLCLNRVAAIQMRQRQDAPATTDA